MVKLKSWIEKALYIGIKSLSLFKALLGVLERIVYPLMILDRNIGKVLPHPLRCFLLLQNSLRAL